MRGRSHPCALANMAYRVQATISASLTAHQPGNLRELGSALTVVVYQLKVKSASAQCFWSGNSARFCRADLTSVIWPKHDRNDGPPASDEIMAGWARIGLL